MAEPRSAALRGSVIRLASLTFMLIAAAAPAAWSDPLASILAHRAAGRAAVDPSAGCGRGATSAPPQLEVDGRTRSLIITLPEPYDPGVPNALVLAFHGRTNSADEVRRYYGLEDHARRPTVFVYPRGLPAEPGRMTWSDPDDPPGDLRDYRLFDRIVRVMEHRYCIDRRRIFAVGHSLGAWFVNSLACARGDVLRAIGTVAGAISASECRDRVAALLLHHPLDRLVPYERGREALDVLLGPPDSIHRAFIVAFAGFECSRFDVDDHPILFCPHHQTRTTSGRIYPHQWPANAGAAIMRFFDELP